jgi:hypothetical protein
MGEYADYSIETNLNKGLPYAGKIKGRNIMSAKEYQDAEVVDTETGELLPAIIEQKTAIANWQGIAQQPFEQKTAKTLEATIPDELIEIRPDGMIYLPQTEYRRILNKAFGVGAWALRRLRIEKIENTVIFDGELWANGRYIAGAMGEQEYYESNRNTSWATAVESAKSDCLTRCCKDIGIAIDLWSPTFIKRWKEQNAVQVWCEYIGKESKYNKPGDKKPLWRKKTESPIDTYPWRESGGKQPPPKDSEKRAETGRTSTQEPKADSSPQPPNPFAENHRVQWVNFLKDHLPIPPSDNWQKIILKDQKTIHEKILEIKYMGAVLSEGDQETFHSLLSDASKKEAQSTFDLDALEKANHEKLIDKIREDFKKRLKKLLENLKTNPPESLEGLAKRAEKKTGKPE